MTNKDCPTCNGDGTKEVYDHYSMQLITVKCNCKKPVKE